MRAGRASRDEAFVDAQLAACRKGAEGTTDALDRWRAFDGCARDFDGLRDVAALRAEAAKLAASPDVARLRAQEAQLAEEERRYQRRFNAWRERFSRRFNDGVEQPALALSESLRMLQVNSLRKRAAGPDPRVVASARRQLAYAHVAASFYLRAQFQARGDQNRVAALEELAEALDEDVGG